MQLSLMVTAGLFMISAISWNVFADEGEPTGWGYAPPLGPSNWTLINDTCDDQKQSPIDIVSGEAVEDENLGVFSRSMFNSLATTFNFTNNKHAVQINADGGFVITDRSVLPADYRLAQFHIHWAAPGEKGSEHTLNGVQYFGELHMVLYNTKYSGLVNAAVNADGLAVLGVFITDDYPQDNLAFGRFLAPIVANNGSYGNDSDVSVETIFALETLLPPSLDVYYRYEGSLTTPPCLETVLWTMFEDPIRISRNQADILETMVFESERGAEPVPLIRTFRPVQPLHGRQVKKSVKCSGGEGYYSRPAEHLLIVCVMLLGYLSFN